MSKTFTVISAVYRLIEFAGARRVLSLVDRGNLGDQTRKDKSAGLPIWSRVTRPEGIGARMHRRQFQ
jgi:type I site-specific restriction endonuclease